MISSQVLQIIVALLYLRHLIQPYLIYNSELIEHTPVKFPMAITVLKIITLMR